MQREERRLDGERDREAQEQPGVVAGAALDQVERPLLQPEDDDRGQHEQRAAHRVDDELDRRTKPAGAAPRPDQDVQRHEHRLEEHVEEQQVLRGEDADDRAREEQHQPEIAPCPVASRPDCVSDRARADDDAQPDAIA